MPGPVHYHVGKFPPSNLEWSRLVPRLGPAQAALGRFDAFLAAIPNPEVLLSPLFTQEAVLSSRIEGTQATVGEVLQYEAGGIDEPISERQREDIEEVINYRRAMSRAEEMMADLPLCHRLIRAVHEELLRGVRGHNKGRGTFRTVENFIGLPGQSVEEARFVPIAPDRLKAGMDRWEKYLHEPALDALVQLAIVHAEFESLHPFLDGNGRIGRILIPLFLTDRKLLSEPRFYMSEYLEAHRQEYVDRLLAVSRDDDWTGWCEFFLQGVEQQAKQNEAKARAMLDLYELRKEWIIDVTHSQYAIRVLDYIFMNPIFNTNQYVSESNIPSPTARRILKVLSEKGMVVLVRPGKRGRSAVYAFAELLSIATIGDASASR